MQLCDIVIQLCAVAITVAAEESVPLVLAEASEAPTTDGMAAPVPRKWMDSPSKAVISDCIMVWAEDRNLLNSEEILGYA